MAKADPVGGSHKASQGRDLVRRRGSAPAKLMAKADPVGGNARAAYPPLILTNGTPRRPPTGSPAGMRPGLADSPSRGE